MSVSALHNRLEVWGMLTVDEEQKNEFLGLVTRVREHNLCLPGLRILVRMRCGGVRAASYLQQRLSDAGAV
jgi:hypothetical protein